MLSTHFLLDIQSGCSPRGSSTKILHAFFASPILAICPAQCLLYFTIPPTTTTTTVDLYKSTFHVMQYHIIFLRSKYFPECCFSLKISDHASYHYKTSGNIFVLYIPIFSIFESRLDDNGLRTE
jgi:hypothetical protein